MPDDPEAIRRSLRRRSGCTIALCGVVIVAWLIFCIPAWIAAASGRLSFAVGFVLPTLPFIALAIPLPWAIALWRESRKDD
jgi:hypothetical protein